MTVNEAIEEVQKITARLLEIADAFNANVGQESIYLAVVHLNNAFITNSEEEQNDE